MTEAVRTSETSVDNHSTRQYNPEDSSERDEYCTLQRQLLTSRDNIFSSKYLLSEKDLKI
jgi:hypothetical protein